MPGKIELFRSQVVSSGGGDILKDASEIAIDSVLSEGLLKEIPIVGTLVNIYKITKGVKEIVEIKKLAKFLSNLNDVSESERKEFDEKLEHDDASKTEFYGRLLILIQNLDELQKAEIVSNFFKLYIYNIITQSDFFRFANIVNIGYLGDLMVLHYSLQQVKGLGRASEDNRNLLYNILVQENLYSLGLLRKKTEEELAKDKETPLPKHTNYFPTKTGEMFSFMMYYNESTLEGWKKNGHNFFNVNDKH